MLNQYSKEIKCTDIIMTGLEATYKEALRRPSFSSFLNSKQKKN
jgi:hypothetical protein